MTSQPGSARVLSTFSAATTPPTFSTALLSAAGTLTRASSRAKNATVSVSVSMPSMAAATAATSASFQRSTPSAITNRRPSAKVIAVSAPATASARTGVALEELDAALAALGLGHRPQLRAALADPAVVVAVDEVGGLEAGHPASLVVDAYGTVARTRRRTVPSRSVR